MILIATTGENRSFLKIAKNCGYEYGCQLPANIISKLYFVDQDWKKPNFKSYFTQVALHKPNMATVLDLEYSNQYQTVMEWAEEAALWVNDIIIIPKVDGIIKKIPKSISNKRVVLGYSVPSEYGQTTVPKEEFFGWPVHLLGGEPIIQRGIYYTLKRIGCEVISVDMNYAQKMATKYCQFFTYEKQYKARNRNWPTLKEYDLKSFDGHGPNEAFRRSCIAIKELWYGL